VVGIQRVGSVNVRHGFAIGLVVVTLVVACRQAAKKEEPDVKLFGFGSKAAPAKDSIPEIDRAIPPVVRTATFAVG
jgi:hypothetical protein